MISLEKSEYAVVDCGSSSYSFTKLHETKEKALKEASRLCKETRYRFVILRTVGYVEAPEVPVEYKELN